MSADFALMMTAILPEELLIEQLEESLQAYKLNPNEDTKEKLYMNIAFMSMKLRNGDSIDKAIDTAKELAQVKQFQEAFSKDSKLS